MYAYDLIDTDQMKTFGGLTLVQTCLKYSLQILSPFGKTTQFEHRRFSLFPLLSSFGAPSKTLAGGGGRGPRPPLPPRHCLSHTIINISRFSDMEMLQKYPFFPIGQFMALTIFRSVRRLLASWNNMVSKMPEAKAHREIFRCPGGPVSFWF